VWIRSYPVSIDVDQFLERAESPAVLQEQRNISRWRPNKLILRVDRSDPSKNLLRGFAAYDHMLQAHPELIGEVQFWAYLQPSRQDVPFYRKYLEDVQFVVRELNQRFGHARWKPVRLELREDLDRAIAAYKEFDVLLVNSIYDGMNLVAKEGMMVNERDGVLILSENTGCYAELGQWAFTINPFDVDQTAEALYLALTMRPTSAPRSPDPDPQGGAPERHRPLDLQPAAGHQGPCQSRPAAQPLGPPPHRRPRPIRGPSYPSAISRRRPSRPDSSPRPSSTTSQTSSSDAGISAERMPTGTAGMVAPSSLTARHAGTSPRSSPVKTTAEGESAPARWRTAQPLSTAPCGSTSITSRPAPARQPWLLARLLTSVNVAGSA